MFHQAIVFMLLSGGVASAEGAVSTYSCTRDDGSFVTFSFAPQDLNDHRAGSIQVSTEGTESLGTTAGDLGPWSWNAGGVVSTLLLDGIEGDQPLMLLHQLNTGATPPASTLTHLTCEAPT